ncbi:hypothetical protein FHW89_001683 [Mucilaginibacter sp. SG564]|nr:hypothetical protein [Mucilaginibacter sp. SG564]
MVTLKINCLCNFAQTFKVERNENEIKYEGREIYSCGINC